MITYDSALLTCSGVSENTRESFDCFLKRAADIDTLSLRAPLLADEEGVVAAGSIISVQVGPITNPLSSAPVTGFTI